MVLPDAALPSMGFMPSTNVDSEEEQLLPEPMQFLSTEFDMPTPPTFDNEDWDEQFGRPPRATSLKGNTSTNEKSHRPRYYCVKCARAFSRPDNLRRHLKRYCKKAGKGTKM